MSETKNLTPVFENFKLSNNDPEMIEMSRNELKKGVLMLAEALRVISGQTRAGDMYRVCATNFYPSQEFIPGKNPGMPEAIAVLLKTLRPKKIAELQPVLDSNKRNHKLDIYRSDQIYQTQIPEIYLIQENAWEPNSTDERVSVELKLARENPNSPYYSSPERLKASGYEIVKN